MYAEYAISVSLITANWRVFVPDIHFLQLCYNRTGQMAGVIDWSCPYHEVIHDDSAKGIRNGFEYVVGT
jgi:hypothetical protein